MVAPKSEPCSTTQSDRAMLQTFSPLIISLVALAIMPLCIPNLWEILSGVPTIAIVGFSAGIVLTLAALGCAIVQRARHGEAS